MKLISWHISIESSKKNPRWVELKGKIWSNSTTNKELLHDLVSPRKNRMMNHQEFSWSRPVKWPDFCRLQARENLTVFFY